MDDVTRPLAIITGASQGIGRALATRYARDGYDLALVARGVVELESAAAELRAEHGVDVLVIPADLSVPDGVASVLGAVEPHRARVRALVNNAGFGVLGRFHDMPAGRQHALVELNITALTRLTHAVLPWLVSAGEGHVMNMGSVAGFQPGPLMATYYASKAYVLAFSEALHNELAGTGVTVTCVCPGPTRTGFQSRAGVGAGAPSGGPPSMSVETVADLAYRGTLAGRRVVITGVRNRVAAFLGRHLPHSWSAAIVRRIQEARLRASKRPRSQPDTGGEGGA